MSAPRRVACSRAAAAAAALALAAGAGAHSLVRPAGAVVSYISADATSLNTLTVRASGSRIEFRDPTVDGGMDPGDCTPGDISADANAWIIQTFCPAAGVRSVRLDLGEREDTATVSLDIPTTLLGGPGADRLTGGPAADQLSGDDGDDVLAGGGGGDVVVGGLGVDELGGDAGDDDMRARDGIQDLVRCGDGSRQRRRRHARRGRRRLRGGRAHADRRRRPAPAARAIAWRRASRSARRRASASRDRARVRVFASSTESGFVAASGALRIDGLALPLKVVRRRIAVAGGGAELARDAHRERAGARRCGRCAGAGRSASA